MKRKKGFTLIELLAVIVILAIIALIATPLVLKYIEKSRKESKVDSAYSFVRNLETEIANFSIKHNGKKYNGQPSDKGYYELDSFNGSEIDTTVKGENPEDGKVCISSVGQVEKGVFKYGKYYVSYDGKKGSISDKDTYDNFNCSGNVAGVNTVIVPKQEIEFIDDDGDVYAIPDTCFDTSLFEYGNYYNVVLTDINGKTYSNKLIAQNSADELTSVDDPLSFYLSHPNERIIYIHNKKQNQCALYLFPDMNGNFLYSGKYDVSIEADNEKVEPNYVFRMTEDGDYIGDFSFFSSDLKSGDEVRFEFANGKTYILNVCDSCTDEKKIIYNKQYYKKIEKDLNNNTDNFRFEIVDVNIIINNGEKVLNLKKEEFIEKRTESGDRQYYIGNNDIHKFDIA